MVEDQTMGESGPEEYNKVVITKNMETVDAFPSHVIPMKVEKAYTGEHINIITQVLRKQRWLSTVGSHCSKHVHQVEER